MELPPPVIDAALGLDVEAVLMEGYRRVDEWHLIERAIDNFRVRKVATVAPDVIVGAAEDACD
jgi:hypothetical protein